MGKCWLTSVVSLERLLHQGQRVDGEDFDFDFDLI